MIINKHIIIFFFAILLSMLHWPSFFSHADVATVEIRYTIWFLAFLFIIFNLNWRWNFHELVIIGFIFTFIVLELILFINPSRNVYSYYSTLLIIILYYNYLRSNKEGRKLFIKFWIAFSYIVISFSILVFIINNFSFISFDPLNFYDTYHHPRRYATDTFTFFGKSSFKEDFFGLFDVHRVSGYFNEPGDLGFFVVINLLIIKSYYKTKIFSIHNKNKLYTLLTLLCGLVSFSLTCYIAIFILLLFEIYIEYESSLIIFLGLLPLIIISIIFFESFEEILSTSSLADRYLRISCGLSILNNSSSFNILFGLGLEQTCDLYLDLGKHGSNYNPGFSTGYLKTLIGRGLFSLAFILFFMYTILRNNKLNILFFLLYFFALIWSTQYIFLFLMLVLFSISIDLNGRSIE